jgi:hypothetical protein
MQMKALRDSGKEPPNEGVCACACHALTCVCGCVVCGVCVCGLTYDGQQAVRRARARSTESRTATCTRHSANTAEWVRAPAEEVSAHHSPTPPPLAPLA